MNPPLLSLTDAANSLNVSPSVLTRWLNEFGEFFTLPETDADDVTFSDEELLQLEQIKAQLDEGHSFDYVRQTLTKIRTAEASTPQNPKIITDDESGTAITTLGYFSEIVDELHKGQLSVLNSQAANRELMGVLIQDNFNLKEENQRLRERMLDVERRLSQIQRDEITRRENLRQEIESKLSEIRMQVLRNPVTVLQERTGCLPGLFGQSRVKKVDLGQEQTSTTPRPPRPPGPPE